MDMHADPPPPASATRSRLATAGSVLAAVIGVAFVLIGLQLVLAGSSDLPGASPAALRYARLFGLRDAFLGAFTLVLVIARERRALLLLLCFAMVLPVADTAALAGPVGLPAAAARNLPFEVPLLVATLLLAMRPAGR
jgi:hypothetical protein